MIIKNENNILIPAYLNKDFFVNALEEGLRAVRIILHEVNFEWGSNPGDNYCSSIYRVLLTFEKFQSDSQDSRKEKLSLIIKTIPITEGTQFLEDVGVFIKEKVTYLDVLPRLEILSNGDKFGARCLYTIKAPIQTIVFNDLKVDGFSLASRQDGLDWNHCEIILKQLAKFHATSMVLIKKDPSIVKRFQKGMLSPETIVKSDTFMLMFGGNLEYLSKFVNRWTGFERIGLRLQYYYKHFKELTAKLALAKAGDRFSVLNHGDMWTTNFMFAYDDTNIPNKPTRAIFVDFQLCFHGSPACDLNFFFNTSVQLDLLQHRRDDLINVYYNNFTETLRYLRFDQIPTLDDLKYELRSRELYGLFALYGFLPIVTLPKDLSHDSSIDALVNEEYKNNKYAAIFANEKLQEHFKYSLKRLEELGVLDEF